MKRFLILVAIALPLFADSARSRAVGPPPGMMDDLAKLNATGSTVTGVVSSVSGSTISLANGLVTIDASSAKILGSDASTQTIAAIKSGSLVFVVLKPADTVAANAALPAAIVTIVRTHDVTLSGTIQSVDSSAGTFTLLGRTIKITSDTLIDGVHNNLTLTDLLPGLAALVEADVKNGVLVASEIHVVAKNPRVSMSFFHATVKSTSTTAWVITTKEKDVTLKIDAQTKIVGSPVVGDSVDVVATVDSAGAYTAVTIMKVPIVLPTQHVHVVGTLKHIDAISAVVTSDAGIETRFTITRETKIFGSPKAGDRVDVVGEQLPLLISPPFINATTITKL